MARALAIYVLVLGLVIKNDSHAQCADVDLNVAIFAYLPDASAAIEKLEAAFEQRYPSIDLDIELWNPYDDAFEDDGISQIVNFDVVEIDTCRIDELMSGAFGGLDKIPSEVRKPSNDYIGPAKTITKTEIGQYVIPHWICGNFLQVWSTNNAVLDAKDFKSFLAAVDPAAEKPLLAAMWGNTALGEYYADAMLDLYGPEKAREHLIALSKGEATLDKQAKEAVIALANELSDQNRSHLSHYHDHSYYLPRVFATYKTTVLIGYSERLYYAERELQLTPEKYPPNIKTADLVVRQFNFGEKSQGTPSWTDAFVIPKGRLAGKYAAIVAFLQFVQTNDAYESFAEPAKYFAPSYLLPATAAAYDEESTIVAMQPLLPSFQKAVSESFPVSDSKLWQGMRKAGEQLKAELRPQ